MDEVKYLIRILNIDSVTENQRLKYGIVTFLFNIKYWFTVKLNYFTSEWSHK